MSRILIVPRCQYGYNTDYFQMANRLAEKGIEVEMICFDQGHTKMAEPPNVHVTYIARKEGSRARNFLAYLSAVSNYVVANRKKIDWVVVSGTIEFCGILPLVLKRIKRNIQWIIDIRTCSVVPDPRKRKIYDRLIRISAYFFDQVTVISGLAAERLKIPEYEVLPLGADCYVDLASKVLNRNELNFLYVGKFDDRRIEDVILAFDRLSEKMNNGIKPKLDIVGFAEREETLVKVMESIENTIHRSDIVYHGRKSHDEIKKLFQTATIGFSYVPITDFFDVQPPTKTYEYLMNGIICIATATKANAEIINEKNGVLTADNADSLLEGIEKVIDNMGLYNSIELSQTVAGASWKRIVDDFHGYLIRIN